MCYSILSFLVSQILMTSIYSQCILYINVNGVFGTINSLASHCSIFPIYGLRESSSTQTSNWANALLVQSGNTDT